MALVTANGQPVFDAQIFTPRFGAWHCDLRIDDATQVSGPVTVVAGARTLRGTAIRSTEFIEVGMVRVLAGAGGLGTTARPQDYTAPTLGMVLGDLLSAAGEALSGTADGGILGTELAGWTTMAEPVGNVIRDLFLAAAPSAAWRFLDDGTFWVGTDAFPDAGIDPTTYQVREKPGEENAVEVAVDGPLPLVATTFEGGHVNCVQDDVPHTGLTTTKVWFENAAADGADRFVAAIQRVVRATAPGLDHRFLYAGPVVAQGGGTVDTSPEVQGVPEMSAVPLFAQAGDSVDGVTGGRALVGWAGDPSRRVAVGFDADAVPATRMLKVLTQLQLAGPAGLPLVTESFLTALAVFLGAMNTYVGAIAPVDPTGGTATSAMEAAISALEGALAESVTLKTVAE